MEMRKIEDVKQIKDKVFIDEFLFHKHRENILRCSQHTVSGCKVKVNREKVGDEIIYTYREGNKQTHTHPLNRNIYIKALLYQGLDKISEAVSREETVSNLVRDLFKRNGLDPDNNDVLNLKTGINYVLKKEKERMDNKNNGVQVDKYFMGEGNKVTVYGDYEAIPIFERSKVMFCDGTFEKKKSLIIHSKTRMKY